jgi:hypothetical protein
MSKKQRGYLRSLVPPAQYKLPIRSDRLVFVAFLTILLAVAQPLAKAQSTPEDTHASILGAVTTSVSKSYTVPPATLADGAQFTAPVPDPTGSLAINTPLVHNPDTRVSVQANGDVERYDGTIPRATQIKCLLLEVTLCHAVHDKPILALTTVQTVVLVSDGVTTRQFVKRGYVEVDPLTRILIGRKPTWGRMAPLGAVQIVASVWVAERMKTSRHIWVRRLWWMPQIIEIAANGFSAKSNLTLHR